MSSNQPEVRVTGPACPECGRDVRWHVLPPGADPSAYRSIDGCDVCVEPVDP